MKKDQVIAQVVVVIIVWFFTIMFIIAVKRSNDSLNKVFEKIDSPMEGTINLSAGLTITNEAIAPGITRTGKITLYSGAGLAITNDEPKIVIHPAVIIYQDTNGYLLKVKILNTNLIQVKTLIKIPEM